MLRNESVKRASSVRSCLTFEFLNVGDVDVLLISQHRVTERVDNIVLHKHSRRHIKTNTLAEEGNGITVAESFKTFKSVVGVKYSEAYWI